VGISEVKGDPGPAIDWVFTPSCGAVAGEHPLNTIGCGRCRLVSVGCA